MHVDMSDFDRAVAKYEEKMDIAKKMLKQGKLSVSEISEIIGFPEEKIKQPHTHFLHRYKSVSQKAVFFMKPRKMR